MSSDDIVTNLKERLIDPISAYDYEWGLSSTGDTALLSQRQKLRTITIKFAVCFYRLDGSRQK